MIARYVRVWSATRLLWRPAAISSGRALAVGKGKAAGGGSQAARDLEPEARKTTAPTQDGAPALCHPAPAFHSIPPTQQQASHWMDKRIR